VDIVIVFVRRVGVLRNYCIGTLQLCILIVLSASRAFADSYVRPDGFRVGHYTFDIALAEHSAEIQMVETLEIDLLNPGVQSIDLDLCGPRSSAAVEQSIQDSCAVYMEGYAPPATESNSKEGDAAGMAVTSVLSNGQQLRFEQSADRLHIAISNVVHPRNALTLILHYHGFPGPGLWIGNNKFGEPTFFSLTWPNRAHSWLATVDHISAKAPKTLIVTAPSNYQVLSNGVLIQQLDLPGDLRRTTWDERQPLPAWQYSLVVGRYAVDYFGKYHGIELSSWLLPQARQANYEVFKSVTEPILDFYAERIGPYPYEKLAQTQVAMRNGGGLELASDIIYGLDGEAPKRVIAHEMAHQWFGNSVSESDWDEVWLSEGFATYFALLYEEHELGRDAFLEAIRTSAHAAMEYAQSHPNSTIVHQNLQRISELLDNHAQEYEGGAQVLHMLRGVLGTDTFWKGIRLYYSRFQHANASSKDLQHAMEDACNSVETCPLEGRDLKWFFAEWLHRGGFMRATGTWHYDRSKREVRVSVEQRSSASIYKMPVELGASWWVGPDGHCRETEGRLQEENGRQAFHREIIARLMIESVHTEAVVPVECEPTDIQLDPQTWVTLMEAPALKRTR
jgi:aminopeptidase N